MLSPLLSDIFNLVADVSAIIVLAGMVLFVFLYSNFFGWTRRRAGKALLFLSLSMLAVAFISFLALWIGPDYWLRPLWRMAGWLFALFSVGYLLYALLYNWKDRGKSPLS